MDYQTITNEQEREINLNRLAAVEREHYDLTLTIEAGKLISGDTEPAAAAAVNARRLADLETQIVYYRERLASIPVEPEPDNA